MEKKESLLKEELLLLQGREVKIEKDVHGNLLLEIRGGKRYANIEPRRTFPYSYKDKFILLKDKDGKEIAILEDLAELEDESRRYLQEELEKLYYIPQIQKVHSIDYRMRTPVWTVETDRGRITFELIRRSDARFIKPGHLVVRDSTGARYEVPDYNRLDRKSQELIEREV